jgi:hypothetical protein
MLKMSRDRKIVVPEAPPVGAANSVDPDRSGSNAMQIKVDDATCAKLEKRTSNDVVVPSGKDAGDGIVGGQTEVSGESGRKSAGGKIEAEKQGKDPVVVLVVFVVGALVAWALVSESNHQVKRVEQPVVSSVGRAESYDMADEPLEQDVSQSVAAAGGDQKPKIDLGENEAPVVPESKPPANLSYSPPTGTELPASKTAESSHLDRAPVSTSKIETRPPSPILGKLKVINVDRNDTLSVRRGPSASTEKLGRIPSNTKGIGLLSFEGRKNGSDTWYQIWWNGSVGWVNGSFVDYE